MVDFLDSAGAPRSFDDIFRDVAKSAADNSAYHGGVPRSHSWEAGIMRLAEIDRQKAEAHAAEYQAYLNYETVPTQEESAESIENFSGSATLTAEQIQAIVGDNNTELAAILSGENKRRDPNAIYDGEYEEQIKALKEQSQKLLEEYKIEQAKFNQNNAEALARQEQIDSEIKTLEKKIIEDTEARKTLEEVRKLQLEGKEEKTTKVNGIEEKTPRIVGLSEIFKDVPNNREEADKILDKKGFAFPEGKEESIRQKIDAYYQGQELESAVQKDIRLLSANLGQRDQNGNTTFPNTYAEAENIINKISENGLPAGVSKEELKQKAKEFYDNTEKLNAWKKDHPAAKEDIEKEFGGADNLKKAFGGKSLAEISSDEAKKLMDVKAFTLPDGMTKEELNKKLDAYFENNKDIADSITAQQNNTSQLQALREEKKQLDAGVKEKNAEVLQPLEAQIHENATKQAELDKNYKDGKKDELFAHFAKQVGQSSLMSVDEKKEALAFLSEKRLESHSSQEFLDKISEKSSPVHRFTGDEVKDSGVNKHWVDIKIQLDKNGNRVAVIADRDPSAPKDENGRPKKQFINLEEQGGNLNLSGLAKGRDVTIMAEEGVKGVKLIGTEDTDINFVGPGTQQKYAKETKNARGHMVAMKGSDGKTVMGSYTVSEHDKYENPKKAFEILGEDKQNETKLTIAGARAEARENFKEAQMMNRELEGIKHATDKTQELNKRNNELLGEIKSKGGFDFDPASLTAAIDKAKNNDTRGSGLGQLGGFAPSTAGDGQTRSTDIGRTA